MTKPFSLFLALSLFVGGPALAETTRVNPSKSKQLPSILTNLRDGDTLIFERGTYETAKGLEIASLNNVTLRGEGKVDIVLGNLDEPVLTVTNCTRVKIEGLHARHQNPNREYACEGAVIEVRSSQHVGVSECSLNGCGAAGVYAADSKDLVIVNNTIFNNTFAAVWCYDSSARIQGNRIFKNAAELITGGDSDVVMIDNTIEKNEGSDYSKTDWVREVLGER